MIARHLPDGWSVDDEKYLRLDTDTAVSVLWDGSPRPGSLGTTGHFSSVDGVAYVDRRIFAFIDRERQDWYLKRQECHVPALFLRPHEAGGLE